MVVARRRAGTTTMLAFAVVATMLACDTAPAEAQSRRSPSWRVGAGYLISRPFDAKLWGLHVRRESGFGRVGVLRYGASADFLGGGPFNPTLALATVEVGARAGDDRGGVAFTIGPSIGLFSSPTVAINDCNGECTERGDQYDSGFIVVGTAVLGGYLTLSPRMQVFYEGRGHIPSRWGRAGYRGDPHAGFVEIVLGIAVKR